VEDASELVIAGYSTFAVTQDVDGAEVDVALSEVCRSGKKRGMLFRVMALGWLIPKL
jgi:hypothetical protein